MRFARLAELVRLANQMQGRADGVSLDEIGETYHVSRRTAERMRDALIEVFPQIEEIVEPGGRKRWRMPPGTTGRMANPTINDLAALNRAVELATSTGDDDTANHLRILSDRLRARLSPGDRRRLDPDIEVLLEADGVALRPGPREQIPPETLSDLRQAILRGVWIEVDHRSRATGLLSRNARLGPIAFLLGEGRQYLVAWSEWADEARMFALMGFERITLTNQTFERPQGFDLKAWQSRSFGLWREDEHDIVWRFSADAAPEARHYRFHPSQTMADEPDGSLVVSFRACGLKEMCWHLFRWGQEVEIISPPELRALYSELLDLALVANGRGGVPE
ncbi:MAG: WYL domain-containing protein [Beijerinckiaceae bacterium]|nr:WYL domain-containing protein [Beijerinckiaceae bacterium]